MVYIKELTLYLFYGLILGMKSFITKREEFLYIMFYEDNNELDAACNQPLTWRELIVDENKI